MSLQPADLADIAPPSRDVCVAVSVVLGGLTGMTYGAATDNWPVFVTGAIATMVGLSQLLGGIGVLLMRLRAIRARQADGGDNV
ncbi:hypothetical protein [Actinokineospora sp. HUAS TT18]|uniref:hypothetical protein n=1 Tax=Actinokineospora sp. HUAS TT18 TaxID=3447451 RepID=UPI003F51C901